MPVEEEEAKAGQGDVICIHKALSFLHQSKQERVHQLQQEGKVPSLQGGVTLSGEGGGGRKSGEEQGEMGSGRQVVGENMGIGQ